MTKKEASDKQEKLVAKLLGWKQVTGSGSRNNFPGDVSGDEWLGECKTHVTPNNKIHFKKSVWDKISEEASSRFKYPAYFVDDGSQKRENIWVIFRERDLPKDFKITPYISDVDISLLFYEQDLREFYQTTKDVVFVFNFNTTKDKFELCRNKLYLAKLTTFMEIIS